MISIVYNLKKLNKNRHSPYPLAGRGTSNVKIIESPLPILQFLLLFSRENELNKHASFTAQ